MKRKPLIVVIVLVVVSGAGAAAFWPFHHRRALTMAGIVEVQEVHLGSKVGGRVESVMVREGAIIYKNMPLVTFEAPELKNQRLQAKARLDGAIADWKRTENGPRIEEKLAAKAAMESAKARWDRAVNGYRLEEVEQAENDWKSAEADYKQAVEDWDRIEKLFRREAAARADYDAAKATRDRARGREASAHFKFSMMKSGMRAEDKAEAKAEYEKAREQYEQLQKGSRWEDIVSAKAKADELQAMLEAIDINLAETTVIAPPELGKAVIEVISVRAGDLVPANQPIIRVLRIEDLWVKIFVPETQYGLVKLDQQVDVTIDSHPGRVFKGVVIQRGNISEYTPRNVQSVDERRYQVFPVKIRILEPDGVFNAGMAAEVTIPLD